MKKVIVLLICLMLLLCACGGEQQPETTKPSFTPTTAQTQPETQSEPDKLPESTNNSATQTVEESLKDKAMTCLDKSVEELFALVGEPESSEYGPSCLGPGEDGCLYYEGFTVYTYKEGDQETVQYVE